MKNMPDRNAVKRDYLSGRFSYRDLAAKYNISVTTVKNWAKADNWQELVVQMQHKTDTKIVEATAGKKARLEATVFDVAGELLKRLGKALDQEPEVMEPDTIRKYASALKDIKDIRGDMSKGEAKKQRAQIRKLENEAKLKKLDAEARDPKAQEISISVEGAEEYAG